MGARHQARHRDRGSARRHLLLVGGIAAAGCLVVVAGLVWWGHGSGRPDPSATTRAGATARASGRAATPERATTSPSPTCADRDHWGCEQEARFAAARRYMDAHAADNAYLSVVFTDRRTGHAWRYGPTDHPGWTASTIKLAMAADILRRQRAGQVSMTDADRRDMGTMLNWSDNDAADRLWHRYGGDDQLARFRDVFGMTDLAFVPGFTDSTYWGFVKCTSEDLSHLMGWVLTHADPDDRDYLVDAMRGVAPIQRWGVWAAGRAARPGNKDGWSYETDSYGKHWVLDSVGFAGPGARYTVGIMFQVAPGGTIGYGSHTVSDVVALLFGQPVPAKITVPTPDD